MDFPDEPLNLTMKKMPIAIVAPFSRSDTSVDKLVPEHNDNNNNNSNNDAGDQLSKCSNDFPQDLSLKNKKQEQQCLDLTKNTNLSKNLNPSEQLRNYLLKGEESRNNTEYNRNVYSPTQKEPNTESVKEKQSPDLCSFMSCLDNKFLTAWYMNSLMNHSQQSNPYLNMPQRPNSMSPFDAKSNSSSSNRILNNLLEKKPYKTYTFPSGFDALIKNEMQDETSDPKPKLIPGAQDHKNNVDSKNNQDNEKKKPHIKKPLNAFMLYMKEMRAKVVAECTLKESAAINQILGRRWHSLSRDEQAKYYDKARLERQLHMQRHPGWSARDNYGYGTKKKKRKKERAPIESGGSYQRFAHPFLLSRVPEISPIYGLTNKQKSKLIAFDLTPNCLTDRRRAYQRADGAEWVGEAKVWHALGREEQAKYYELARRERQLHMQLYPDWSSRANATRGKKRKRKQDPQDGVRKTVGGPQQRSKEVFCTSPGPPVLNLLKNRLTSIYSITRKKKCIRYMESGESNDGNHSDDNLGSCGSMGDANTPPDDDNESIGQSMSSPGGLSALSSLTSPGGMVMPSPSTSAASPSVSVASPYMLQSPLTPHDSFDVKLPPSQLRHPSPRNPVGTNPHDINNPLSINQLTSQCVRNESSDSNGKETSRSIISVT
ncbi:hypothetical protein HUJ05_004528 [Dendroctonus ponderosae]|nr:hypothetical protein HUJ05_004528 [Dendroctonus ponderosae]